MQFHSVNDKELFPDEYGVMLDFIHVFEYYEKMKGYITWLPEEYAELNG